MDYHKRNWKIKRLEELCQFQNGYSFKNKDYQNQPSDGYVVFRMGNINRGGGLNRDTSSVYITKDQSTKLKRFVLSKNDIVMCMTDMKASMNLLGHTALIDKDDYYILNQRVGRITVEKKNILDYRYLFYYTNSQTYLEHLRSVAHSGVQVNLSTQAIRESPILLPPLPTQQKIAAVLSAYDDLIENNIRRIEILEEMAQAIYREWFVEFRFPGHEHVEMVESELGLIPQGWKVGILGDLAESVRRNIKPSDINQETPYFGLEHLPRKSIALTDWDVVDSINSAKLAFKKGEILFGKIRPYFHKVGVAPLDGICSSDTIVIHPKRNECFAMTLSCVSSEHFIEYATMTSQGTKMPRADWKVLVKYPVIIPPDQITQRFSSFVRDIVNQIQSLIFRNRNLRQTRDLLLPKLISGEIDVSKGKIMCV